MTPLDLFLILGVIFFPAVSLSFAELEKFCPSLKKKKKLNVSQRRQKLELFQLESVKQVEK